MDAADRAADHVAGEAAAIERGGGGAIAAVGDEVEVAVGIERGDCFERGGVDAVEWTAKAEVKAVDRLGVEKVRVDGGLVGIVEEKIAGIAAQEGFHGVAVIA